MLPGRTLPLLRMTSNPLLRIIVILWVPVLSGLLELTNVLLMIPRSPAALMFAAMVLFRGYGVGLGVVVSQGIVAGLVGLLKM